ncbi:hypothetical protein ACQP2T_63570 (plasmid) [Nonomuraea sp. CA-143628]|uniref:hypothetical protein n=1 Tax=Nonomuraea sp. CA-143628 TaxID=3239997 RepID=UPI003D8A932A
MRTLPLRLGVVALVATALVACGQVPQKAQQADATPTPTTNIGTDQEASPDDVPGVVMAKLGDDEGLMILPIQDAPAYNRKATAEQVKACPMDARYPDCLPAKQTS